MRDIQPLFIAGVWREGAERRAGEIINPATEEPVGPIAHAGPQDVDAAIAAAAAALPSWSQAGVGRRAAVLGDAARIIADTRDAAAAALTEEQGKTLSESRLELTRAVETLLWHADGGAQALAPGAESRVPHIVRPEPIGVVGAFVPWNYPAVIAARKLAAALLAGCTVVLKAAEEAPSAAVHLVRALATAGLPSGVVNVVCGDPPAIAARILDSPVVRAVSFTGSTAVGKQLAQRAALGLKRCVLELGGHAPVLVFADADLEAAVQAVAAYKFECAGQSCNAPSRVYVERPLYEPFVERMARVACQLRVGDGADPSTEMGPLANPRRLAAMTRLTDDALACGARLVTGGARVPRRGYFWPPTILADVPQTAAVMSEEPFGPLLPIAPFAAFEDAVALANASAYGLAAYVFTRSPDTAAAAAARLAAGSVGINELRGVAPDVGMAGIKDSGYGYEGGRLGIEAFLNLKVVRGACS